MKKLLISLLCVVMMVTFMPSMAFADGESLPGEEDLRGIVNDERLEEAIIEAAKSNQLNDLTAESLAEIKIFSMEDKDVADLTGIQLLTGVEELDLSGNKIQDTGFFDGLNNLKKLDLSDNQIADGGGLAKLTNLTELNMKGNLIVNAGFVQGLTNLTVLDLSDNQIVDSGSVHNLTNLKNLNLSGNQIIDTGFAENLSGLETLDLSENQITDGGGLMNLAALKNLNLSNNSMIDIGFLAKLNALETLNLSDNSIADIGVFEYKGGEGGTPVKFDSLTEVDLSDNLIEDPTPIRNLTAVTQLDLSGNSIVDGTILTEVLPESFKDANPDWKTWIEEVIKSAEPEKPVYLGSKGYDTLEEAVEDAENGNIITLYDDINLSESIGLTKEITLNLGGKTVSGSADPLFVVKEGGKLNVNAPGKVAADKDAFRVFGNETPGEEAAASVIKIGANVEVTSETANCVYIRGNGAKADIYGKLTANGNYAAIQGNGTVDTAKDYGHTTINIYEGAAVTAVQSVGIYQPQNGELNISGGIITGITGVYVKSGNLNITNGTLNGTGEKADYKYNKSGCENTGQALVIDTCGYPGGNPTAAISGGTFNTKNAESPIGSYKKSDDPSQSEDENTALTGFITNATFNKAVSEAYLADGLELKPNSDGTFGVQEEQEEPPVVVPPGPSIQHPTIEADEHAKVTLGSDGTTATITVDEGYELADVVLNGVSQGRITFVYGLKTGDILKVTTVKKGETEAEKNARLIKGVQNTTIRMYYKSGEIGKGWIKVRYKKSYGYKVDNYEIFRSTKKNTNFGKTPYFVTKKNNISGFYKNTKNVKKGVRHYYKMRGVREIAGETYYTKWSNLVMRTGR